MVPPTRPAQLRTATRAAFATAPESSTHFRSARVQEASPRYRLRESPRESRSKLRPIEYLQSDLTSARGLIAPHRKRERAFDDGRMQRRLQVHGVHTLTMRNQYLGITKHTACRNLIPMKISASTS